MNCNYSFFNAIKDIAVGYHFDHKTRQFLQEKLFQAAECVLIKFALKAYRL